LRYVRARSATLELEERAAGGGDRVDVRLDPDLDAPGWLGLLRIEGARPLEREVRGERCQDVVEALALITVLRLEGADTAEGAALPGGSPGAASGSPGTATPAAPGASGAPAAPAASGAAAGAAEAAPPSEPSAEGAPAAPEPEPGPSAAVPPAEPAPAPEVPAEPAPAPSGSDAASPPDTAAVSAAAPSVAPGAAASAGSSEPPPLQPDEPITRAADGERVEVDTDESAAPAEPLRAQLAPTLALLAGYASEPGHALKLSVASEVRYGATIASWTSPISLSFARGNDRVDAADLDLSLLTAQLGLCPPALLAESWAWLRVCGNVRAGAVLVQITPRVPELGSDPKWRPWLAVVPSVEIGAPLGERWTLRASAELAVQLVRDTFGAPLGAEADPEFLPLYRPDAVSVEVGLGVGYTF
jgi:hypothetical protein